MIQTLHKLIKRLVSLLNPLLKGFTLFMEKNLTNFLFSETVEDIIRLIGMKSTIALAKEFHTDQRIYFPKNKSTANKNYQRLVATIGEDHALTVCQYFDGCMVRFNVKRLLNALYAEQIHQLVKQGYSIDCIAFFLAIHPKHARALLERYSPKEELLPYVPTETPQLFQLRLTLEYEAMG